MCASTPHCSSARWSGVVPRHRGRGVSPRRRRTFATAAARLGIAPHVVEKVLNHSGGTIRGVAAVYNRAGYRFRGRQRWITIGPVGAIRLAEAREKARVRILRAVPRHSGLYVFTTGDGSKPVSGFGRPKAKLAPDGWRLQCALPETGFSAAMPLSVRRFIG
jgi:hypothetical protein